MIPLPAISLEERFCMSGKSVIGKDGLVHQKGANRIAMSGLICRKALVGTRRAIFILFGISPWT